MRYSLQMVTLLAGLALVALALMMIAATTLNVPAKSDEVAVAAATVTYREFRDAGLGVRFLYPSGWGITERADGVTVQSVSAGGTNEAGTMFAVLSEEPLPALVDSAVHQSAGQRWSENVQVGGVSGTERIIELERARSNNDVESRAASALNGADGAQVTMIVWSGHPDDEQLWVIMADGIAGEHVATLQAMRDSIEWE